MTEQTGVETSGSPRYCTCGRYPAWCGSDCPQAMIAIGENLADAAEAVLDWFADRHFAGDELRALRAAWAMWDRAMIDRLPSMRTDAEYDESDGHA